jgi:hypothetical protein
MSVKKLVLPNHADKKFQICKMSKLQIFVITNICNQIFVTFGRIGTWWSLIAANGADSRVFHLSENRVRFN